MNDNRSYEIVLDRYLKYRNSIPVFTQYDTGTSEITFKFLSNGTKYNIPYTRLVLIIKKPDGKRVNQSIDQFSNNTAKVILLNQALTSVGRLRCQIEMYEGARLESTSEFEIEVRKSLNDNSGIKNEDDYQILQQLIIDVDGAIGKMNEVVNLNIENNNQALENNIFTNNVALCEALEKIDKSELARHTELIKLLEQDKLNKTEASVEATGNTVPRRNADGNLLTGDTIGFTRSPLIMTEDVHLRCGTRKVWDDDNLPIEKGTFTPYGYGGDNAVQFIHTTQRGTYYKVGKMVFVEGEIVSDNLSTASGHFRIGGLPFRVREQHSPCMLGYIRGIASGSANMQVNAFGERDYSFIQFAFNNLNTGEAWTNVLVNKLVTRLGISFSMSYLTD